jgi:hypothetical protein
MPEQEPVKRKRSAQLNSKFYEFLEQHSPLQVGRHLRNIFLDYVSNQLRTGLPPDFHIYIWELYDLFALLDIASDELEKKPVKSKKASDS